MLAHEEEGQEEDKETTMPPQSPRFSGKARAKMIKDWMSEVPEGYTKTLKGCGEGQVGPVKAELANVSCDVLFHLVILSNHCFHLFPLQSLIRLDGVSKAMSRCKPENREYRRLARSCDDYIMHELEVQEKYH